MSQIPEGLVTDELQTKIYDKRLFKKLISYLKPYVPLLILGFFLLLLVTAAELSLPLVIKDAVDNHIVSDRYLLILDDQQDYLNFKSDYRRIKYDFYEKDGYFYLLFSANYLSHLKPEYLDSLKDNNKIITTSTALIYNNEVNRNILAETQYYVLSDTMIALPLVNVEGMEHEKLEKLRTYSWNSLLIFGIIFFAIIFIRLIIHFLQVYIINYAAQHAMDDLRQEVFFHLQKMPLSFFDKNPIGRLVTRVTTDVRALDEMLSQGLINMLQDILIIFGIIIMMLFLNWELALISFSILPFLYILIYYFKHHTRIIYREVRKKIAMLNAALAEDISGVKIIQLFNQYINRCKRFGLINQQYYLSSMSQLKLFAIFRPLISISRHIAVAIILWYGGGQIINNIITLGLFMAFIRYMERFFEPVNQLSEKFNILQAAMSGAERIFDLLEKPTQNYRESISLTENIKGEIEFRDVWLSYNDNNEYALKGVSFRINQGEKIALVGHTGSGKTSIVNLIGDHYQIQKGQILIDKKDLREYSLEALRSNIGIVQQDIFLFSGTIRENITLNLTGLTDERIKAICRYVNVDKFIKNLPEKYNEPVMERGATFSVGQRQLIAFARVLAYNPAIFILDEATSNIDTETEILIQDALRKIMKNRTSIVIAHRLSTIQHVDRIIVLHKGKIVESGSHNELLQHKGLYYDLYRLQYT